MDGAAAGGGREVIVEMGGNSIFFAGNFPDSSVGTKNGFEPKHKVRYQKAEIKRKERPLTISPPPPSAAADLSL